MSNGVSYGVSVGPGEDGLITLEAISIIEDAEIIFLPSWPKDDCKAYQIVKRIYPDIDKKDLRAETFTMSRDSKVMSDRHQEIFESIKPLLDEGKAIAFLTLGEVALFSTYLYIHEKLLAADYKSVLVSGISSVQAIAAKLGKSLALGNTQLHIFPNSKDLSYKLSLGGTRVFMKPRGELSEFTEEIERYVKSHEGAEAFGISNCGMEGEIIAENVESLHKLTGYFTVIFVTGDEGSEMPGCDFFENRACKYYPCHRGIKHMNCMFCYCPMYRFEKCLGNPNFIERPNKVIKDCSGCTFPHEREHYSQIMDFLKNQ